MKYLIAFAVALLIAAGFGAVIGALEQPVSHVVTAAMIVTIYFACRRILTGR